MNNTFFNEGSPWLSHPLLTDERTQAEIDLVLGWCPDATSALDLGCGFGRHSIELARRGLSVRAVDASDVMIAEARSQAGAASVDIDFAVGRAESLGTGAPVDLALLLFTTLGQDPMDGTDPITASAQMLAAAHANLRPGGLLVVEVPERSRLADSLVASEQLGPTSVTRSLDPATGRVTEQFVGPHHTHDLGYVVFSTAELADLVRSAGFDVVDHLDTALVPPPPTFQTIVARRP
jgi:2-polyprenyl-3-methyl-5-hydroxy-6-metoxy-1,4-benzoquinol methylase